MTFTAVLLGTNALCFAYWICYGLRGMARRRIPDRIENDPEDKLTLTLSFEDAPRRYWAKLQQGDDMARKLVLRWLAVWRVSATWIHWSSPAMIVVFPVHYALLIHDSNHVAWDLVLALNSVLWTVLAWCEVKNDRPNWKKRLRSLSKVVQTSGGRLAVVPNKA